MDFHRSLLRRSEHDYTAGDRQHLVAKRRKGFSQKMSHQFSDIEKNSQGQPTVIAGWWTTSSGK